MGATYLDDIVARHRAHAALDGRDWRARLDAARTISASLAAALTAGDAVAVIAEVKRRSPSQGWISRDLDAGSLARAYEAGGAAAISVLSDEESFGGTPADVAAAAAAVSLPILRKDFTVSANDVLDAADMGASAVLLIVAALDDAELKLFLDVATRSGLDAVVEVHDEVEAHRAIDLGATVVGVNQRDLRTFEVDPLRAARVAGVLPGGVVTIAESGMTSWTDVRGAAEAGFDAVLVGESLLRAGDAQAAVRSLTGVAKAHRG